MNLSDSILNDEARKLVTDDCSFERAKEVLIMKDEARKELAKIPYNFESPASLCGKGW